MGLSGPSADELAQGEISQIATWFPFIFKLNWKAWGHKELDTTEHAHTQSL